ncbi:MAG: hypothetical protein IBX47_13490, partial [Desulfuromonadales bacterium]|nr:hypothetical protein [Desulfuromonadales bacterium]
IAGFDDKAYAVTVTRVNQTDRILLAGSTPVDHGVNGTNLDFAVVRLNLDGNLDNTFSGDGKATADFASADEIAYGVGVQSSGKIVVAGVGFAAPADIRLIRYDIDGNEDTTFGVNARASLETGFGPSGSGQTSVSAMLIQPNDKILIAGKTDNYPTTTNPDTDDDLLLARFNENGSVDATFGGEATGYRLVDIGLWNTTVSHNDELGAIALQDDGKIVVAGSTYNGSSRDFIAGRFSADGIPDFFKTVSFSAGDDKATGVAIQPDHRIVVAGEQNSSGADFAAARLEAGMFGSILINDGAVATNNPLFQLTLEGVHSGGAAVTKMCIWLSFEPPCGTDLNNAEWVPYATTAEYPNNYVYEGIYLFQVQYADQDGIISDIYGDEIMYDTTPPVVSINIPGPVNVNSAVARGSLEPDLDSFMITAYGGAVAAEVTFPEPGRWESVLTNLAEGENTFSILATDSAGNNITKFAYVTYHEMIIIDTDNDGIPDDWELFW